MDAQIDYYQSTKDHCGCGQTDLLSAMYGITIPCCHRLRKGAPRPKMNDPPLLVFEDPGFAFTLDRDHHQREDVEAVPGTERIAYLKETAVSNIKRLSKTGKKKQEIRTFVDEWFSRAGEMTVFIQKIPLAVIAFITEAVGTFGK